MATITDRRWLAEARERRGLSQEALARRLDVAAKSISRWERGESLPRLSARGRLACELGLTADDLACRLGLVEPAPVASFPEASGWLSMFVRAEQSAHAIWTFVATALPALCQTERYARCVEAGGHQGFTPEQVDSLVAARMARAAVLERAEYTALVAAPLLDAAVGGPAVMAEQMAHLLALADRPNVTLRVIEVEHLFATPGEFTLLATAGSEPDMATEGGVVRDRFEDGPAAAANHARLFAHLAGLARDPVSSRAVVARSADRFAALSANLEG